MAYYVIELIKMELADYETDEVKEVLRDDVHTLFKSESIYDVYGTYVYDILGYNYAANEINDIKSRIDASPDTAYDRICGNKTTGGHS